MNEMCALAEQKIFSPSTGAHALHIAFGNTWFVLLFCIEDGTTFSRGRIPVRNSADYLSRCQRSRLLPRSGLSRFLRRRCSFWSRIHRQHALGLAGFPAGACLGFWFVTTIFFAFAYFIPLAPVDSGWARRAFRINEDFREEIGWPELVQRVARIRDSLGPADARASGFWLEIMAKLVRLAFTGKGVWAAGSDLRHEFIGAPVRRSSSRNADRNRIFSRIWRSVFRILRVGEPCHQQIRCCKRGEDR